MLSLLKHLALLKQGLKPPNGFGEGQAATLQAIQHLGYVQIDAISVIERAHHHVLWNRVENYELDHLNHLVREKQIFEYWYHAAAYLPIQDYRYTIPLMISVRNGENRYFHRGDKTLMNEILTRIKAEGKLRLRDLDQAHRQNQGNRWRSGPNHRAVEQLIMQGDLMICERNGIQKSYDLTERCLPDNIDLSTPTLREYAQYLFNTQLRAQGVFTWKQLLHLKGGKDLRQMMQTVLNEQVDAGIVSILTTPDGQTVYVDHVGLGQELIIQPHLKILSPFDNLVIHRDRLSTLFQFDYRMECYVPALKREFGYFCLPILYGDEIVGRMDCKVQRAEKRLEVLSLHLEENKIADQDAFLLALKQEIQRFMQFNQCLFFNDNLFQTID